MSKETSSALTPGEGLASIPMAQWDLTRLANARLKNDAPLAAVIRL
jgi:hypothetical protein